jgi:hypothetical protein
MSLVTERSGLSPTFLNPRLVYTATGDQILALGVSNTPKLMLANANSTNGVIGIDKVYFRKNDNTLQVLNLVKHYHDADTDDAGGLLQESLYRNVATTINIQQWGAMLLASHVNIVGTNAKVSGDFDNGTVVGGKVAITTGEFANNVANIRTGGVSHDWSKKSKFNIVCQVAGSTNLVVRAGINAEPMTAVNDAGKKAGMEFCDSTGPYWNIFSSNGVRSILASTFTGATTKQGYQIVHTPATNTRLQAGASSYLIKSNDCPGTGASDNARLIGCGIKTTDTVTKTLYVWGMTFVGTPIDLYY